MIEHDFLPVAGHPDDDECTHRADGTDATYCGQPRVWHDHHPYCYQNTGTPGDLPDDLCDCRILRTIHSPLIGPDGFTRLIDDQVIPPETRCPTCIHPEGYDRLSGPCPTCGGDGVIPAGGSDD